MINVGARDYRGSLDLHKIETKMPKRGKPVLNLSIKGQKGRFGSKGGNTSNIFQRF